MEVAQRVESGATLLDATMPGWHRDVDTSTLNIARGDRCALGQTYGSFSRGVQVLGLTSTTARQYGFNAGGAPVGTAREFEALTAEWRRVIEERLDTERAAWAVEQADHPVFRRYRLARV